MSAKRTIPSCRDPAVAALQQAHDHRDAAHGPQRPRPPNSSRQIDQCPGAADYLPAVSHQLHLVSRFRERGEPESASSQPPLAATRPGRAESALSIVIHISAIFISCFCNYRIHSPKKSAQEGSYFSTHLHQLPQRRRRQFSHIGVTSRGGLKEFEHLRQLLPCIFVFFAPRPSLLDGFPQQPHRRLHLAAHALVDNNLEER